MDELVMTHRPDLWTKHQFRPKWGRKKRELRKNFEGQLLWFRWRQKNPHASCLTCAHREEYRASKTGYACGLEFESGGWFTPVRDDFVCGNFKASAASQADPTNQTKQREREMSDNDPKYDFRNGGIINEASGERIPDDEPCMVFRARDKYAWFVITYYLRSLINADADADHIAAVTERSVAFGNFRADYPDRMKTPDTESSA